MMHSSYTESRVEFMSNSIKCQKDLRESSLYELDEDWGFQSKLKDSLAALSKKVSFVTT